jgi:hypothetical protein
MRVKPIYPQRLAALLVGLSLLPASLFGQEAKPKQKEKPTAFLVVSRSLDEAVDQEFQKLIDQCMRLELQQHRLAVLTEAGLPNAGGGTAWPLGEASALELQEQAVRIGRKTKADFIILCSFSRILPEMQMRFDCYDIAAGNLVCTETERRSLALLLDWSITKVIGKILDAIGPRLVYLEVPPAGRALTAEPAVGGERIRSYEEPPPPPSFPPVEPVEHPLEFSLCLSPLFMVGEAADYFRLGFFPSVNGSFRLYTRAGYLSLGASLGLLSFYAESPSAQARGYLIPLAATAAFLRPFPGSRLTFQLRLASGPALFVLAPRSAVAQAKVLAYLGTGIGAELSLSPAWGVRVELDYSIFFERLQPIMGYAPAVYGFYRF